jgi:hypothetical protein
LTRQFGLWCRSERKLECLPDTRPTSRDGISFKTYALNCARAFGACVTLRDEPGGGENIPDEFTPSDYNAKAAQKARDELAALLNLTPDQRERRAAKAWDEAETSRLMRPGGQAQAARSLRGHAGEGERLDAADARACRTARVHADAD